MIGQLPPLHFAGKSGMQGIYILHLNVGTPINVTFGRFQAGRPISIPAGDYLYVGSALGRQGATTLAGRLLRHTTRSGDLPPHVIQAFLRTQLLEQKLLTASNTGIPCVKRLFWHIDYLLDRLEAEITQIFILHTGDRVESTLARALAADPAVTVIAPGLGASDDPHAAHLLRVDAPGEWWHNVPQQLLNQFTDS